MSCCLIMLIMSSRKTSHNKLRRRGVAGRKARLAALARHCRRLPATAAVAKLAIIVAAFCCGPGRLGKTQISAISGAAGLVEQKALHGCRDVGATSFLAPSACALGSVASIVKL